MSHWLHSLVDDSTFNLHIRASCAASKTPGVQRSIANICSCPMFHSLVPCRMAQCEVSVNLWVHNRDNSYLRSFMITLGLLSSFLSAALTLHSFTFPPFVLISKSVLFTFFDPAADLCPSIKATFNQKPHPYHQNVARTCPGWIEEDFVQRLRAVRYSRCRR